MTEVGWFVAYSASADEGHLLGYIGPSTGFVGTVVFFLQTGRHESDDPTGAIG